MNEVSCRTFVFFFDYVKESGVSIDELMKGLPYSKEYLLNPKNRIDWNSNCIILKNLEKIVGGREEMVRLGTTQFSKSSTPFFKTLLSHFATPARLYRAVNRHLGPMQFTPVTCHDDQYEKEWAQFTLKIDPGYEDCPGFFWLTTGGLISMPRMIGLGDAAVEADITDHACTYTVQFPSRNSIWMNLRNASRFMILGRLHYLEDVSGQQQEFNLRLAEMNELRRDFQELIERTPVGILVHKNGRVLYANEAIMKSLHLSDVNALIGRDFEQFVMHTDVARWRRLLDSTSAPNTPVEVRLVTGDEDVSVLEMSSVRKVHFGGQDSNMLLARDVTQQRELEHDIVRISTKEQERIAHDLHDGLGQLLLAVAFRGKVMEKEIRKGNVISPEQALEVVDLAMQASQQARQLARGLDPVVLDREGLYTALNDLAFQTQQRFEVHCVCACSSQTLIRDKFVATHLYRIAQEAVNNAVRHSNAEQIRIQLAAQNGSVNLSVQDNGSGMPDNGEAGSGMGIRNMRYRARLVGGELNITSSQNAGTTVTCIMDSSRVVS